MIDSLKEKNLRKKLIDELREKGIGNESVLNAMYKVPRHYFMDSGFIEYAYRDKAFPISSGQTISQPFTVAFQTQLLQVKENDKILEIGTGSGYQAAILSEMGAKVFSIERIRELFTSTKALLSKLNYSVRMFYGDGNEGLPAFEPFDKIIITAAAPEVSETLKNQLKNNGIIVVPIGKGDTQVMKTIEKKEGKYVEAQHGYFAFVPLLKGIV